MIEEIRFAAPKAKITESEYEPIVGAVLMALDQLGVSEDETVLANIRRDATRLKLMRKTQI